MVLMVGGMFRSLSLTLANDHAARASLFHNPFGPRPLATNLRVFQAGDSWDYHVSGTATSADGKSATMDGILSSTISNVDLKGQFNTLSEEDAVNMTTSADGRTSPFSHTSRQTLSQDWLKATTFLLSDDQGSHGAVRTVRQPQVDTPGNWSVGTIQTVHLEFDNGDSRNETTTVSGSEVVDTALGKFTVWRCLQDQTDSDGTQDTTTLWFAPQLGMPVKTSETTTQPDGMVMTLNTDLTKTSVPF